MSDDAGLGAYVTDLSGAQVHVVIALVLVLVGSLYLLLLLRPHSALPNLPGPARASWVLGNAGQMLLSSESEPGTAAQAWLAEYGGTIAYHSLLGTRGFATTDLTALAYITRNAYEFVKPRNANALLGSILGDGVLTAEGAAHRRQRRVLNPAFGPGRIRAFVPSFLDTTRALARKWAGVLESGGNAAHTDKVPGAGAKIDVLRGLHELTLDVLGTTVFGIDFPRSGRRQRRAARAGAGVRRYGGRSVPP